MVGLFVVITCAALNVAGIRVVGVACLWLFFVCVRQVALGGVLSGVDVGVWDVQRGGDELFAVAAGDGAGWDAAKGAWQDTFEDAGAVGRDCGVGDRMGALLGIGI